MEEERVSTFCWLHAEFMIHADVVWVLHGLQRIVSLFSTSKLAWWCCPYKLELRRNLPQNQTIPMWQHQVIPTLRILRVNVTAILLHPFNASRLGIAVVENVVDMTLSAVLANLHNAS